MAYPNKIDLHMHSFVSDGTDDPKDIISQVKAAGITLFSLTDHDAVKGSVIIKDLLSESDPEFINGAEFSCKDEEGQYHILAYGYDPEADAMTELVASGHAMRVSKLGKRLAFLESEFGFVFPKGEIDALYSLDNPGKPHLGNLMVRYGYAPTKDAAIRDYINKFHARSEYVRPETAIDAILRSGGIPVLAHPSYGRGDELILGDEMDRRLRKLIDFGIMGVEAFYSGFTPKLQAEILGFADKYRLYVTAGSDYHGKNKIVRLGDTNLSGPEEYPTGLRRFLDDVRRSR